ncbi:MAG: hypothetical protein ACKVW3_05005 [Phycisphaerales bacterium]
MNTNLCSTRQWLGVALLLSAGSTHGQVIYDNGPIVTHIGGGAAGANFSAVQTVLGLQSQGFTHASPSDRLSDDFTVPGPGSWTISAVEFHTFQTNASTAMPTITALNLRVWSARPGDAGATVLFGNTTTNRLESVGWGQCFRGLDTDLANTTRAVMVVRGRIEPALVLPPGTYWVDWQATGTLPSGPWGAPVTILGQLAKPGANGRIFLPSVGFWRDVKDSAGTQAVQDLSFRLIGTGGGGGGGSCVANCDASTAVPFLNVNDFVCFTNRFATGDTRANCDLSTVTPILNVNDFVCFNNAFVAGCSAP